MVPKSEPQRKLLCREKPQMIIMMWCKSNDDRWGKFCSEGSAMQCMMNSLAICKSCKQSQSISICRYVGKYMSKKTPKCVKVWIIYEQKFTKFVNIQGNIYQRYISHISVDMWEIYEQKCILSQYMENIWENKLSKLGDAISNLKL